MTGLVSTTGLLKGKAWVWHVVSLAGLAAAWELLARLGWINALLFPPPSALWEELFHSRMLEFYKAPYAQEGTELLLVNSVLASLLRVVAGISCGFTLALGCGFLIAYSKIAERLLLPLMTLMAPVSPVAWIPFAMVIFGIGNKPALLVVIVSVFFLITIATASSIRNVDPAHLLWARQYGANRIQTLRYVVFPSILPSLFLVLRVNFFAAWMSVLAAEMVGVSQGLGQMVMVGRSLFNMKLILIAMILIGLCGYVMDRLLYLLQRRVLGWRPDAIVS